MTHSKLLGFTWIVLAITFPLFGVQFFRFNQATLAIHLAAPMFALVVTTVVALLEYVIRRKGGPAERTVLSTEARRLMWLGYSFLLWHGFGVLQSVDLVFGLREFYKIAMGLMCLTVIVLFFPRDERSLARFWVFVIWSTTVLLSYLIYTSVEQNVPYLVSELEEVSRAAKNQLAGFMVYVFPFVLGYVGHRGRGWLRPLQVIPLLVFSVALLYNGSRGGWVAATCSLIVVMAMSDPATRVRRVLITIVVAIVAIGAAYFALDQVASIERLDYYDRVMYFYDPDSVPQFDTWNERSSRIYAALDVFKGSPLFGAGLGSTGVAIGTLPHNDYVLILGDLGVVGLLLFIGIVSVLVRLLLQPARGGALGWLQVAWRAGLVGELVFMLTMDRIYSTTLFWAFVGMALVAMELERGLPAQVEPWPVGPPQVRLVDGRASA